MSVYRVACAHSFCSDLLPSTSSIRWRSYSLKMFTSQPEPSPQKQHFKVFGIANSSTSHTCTRIRVPCLLTQNQAQMVDAMYDLIKFVLFTIGILLRSPPVLPLQNPLITAKPLLFPPLHPHRGSLLSQLISPPL